MVRFPSTGSTASTLAIVALVACAAVAAFGTGVLSLVVPSAVIALVAGAGLAKLRGRYARRRRLLARLRTL